MMFVIRDVRSRCGRVNARVGALCALALTLMPATETVAQASAASKADSVRREAGRLAAEGNLDEAQALVGRHARDLPAVWNSMFAGKLEADGEASARGYTGASSDSAPEQMRGESVFRLGQYHYAADRFHLAIPQFRLYLQRHPSGVWSQEAAYWMAHACLQLVKRQPARAAYLDTALAYLRLIEAKGSGAYFWPLARAAQARALMARGEPGDTAAAIRALQGAHGRMPPEETPGLLLLSLQADPQSPKATAWEDSLRWTWPLSPEARSLSATRAARPTPTTPAVPEKPRIAGTHTLQLGVFSLRDNAERLVKELAGRKVIARIAPLRSGDRELFRVLSGGFHSAAAAEAEGKRLKTLGYEYRVVGM